MLTSSPFPPSPFPPGSVALVGAGPGDPELLTLKALHRLQQAEVIVYDNLVAPEILAFAPSTAERIYVGKAAGNHTLPQEDISQLLLELARAGRRVVRLKGGDPFVFGRGGEEMEVLLENGIAVDIVPGITAALGAAAAFGFPLTHRDHAQSCVFVTGHLKDHTIDLNWAALAQPNQTVVIYMGVKGLEIISERLQAAGLPGDTPAALIYKATWPQQRIYPSRLDHLPQTAREFAVKPPTLLVIGSVVGLLDKEKVHTGI
ncbi:uroporphyrinogen-III C-methyltransferase [Quatrionicoccus australiensis]|uniref:uroporphyrinogen-III C-methyltransferase n=1 Tax=Quatrionicoccus australiensis TaxID=138118 RepID=UPI001CFC228A|nr:uroporphyrinogen-III C-methyltransferase [Quatrionicoccus australiensis]MCB4361801.1 uroporphyrinogen-III C-methyltransferase [Quatrionicoccus australiensis]